MNRGDLPGARSKLEAARALEPANPRVWLALAQTYARLLEPRRAEEAARKVEALASGDVAVLRALAFYHNQVGKATGDAAPLREAVRLDSYEESYHFDLASALLRAAKFDEAVQSLEAGRKIFARSPQLDLALGVALYGQRRFDDSIGMFLRIVQTAPDVEQPYVFLSKMIDQAGARTPEIAAACAAFAKSNPASYLAQYVHAKALAAQGIDAEKALRASIALKDDYADSHFELGAELDRKRQWTEAAREFERAAALDPKDPASQYRLARVYDRLKKPSQAAQARALHERLTGGSAPGIALK